MNIDFGEYYNPNIVMEKEDLDGNKPSIILVSGNRSAGKTTGFLVKQLEFFREEGKQAILIYRYSYELSAAHEIYSDCLSYYPELGTEMTSKSKAKGLFYILYLDGEQFGFALALSNVDALKKYSPIFSKTFLCIFDEFQTESGDYLKNEVQKLMSLLVTVSRGGGKQSRQMKLVLLSNNVTLMNPYYIAFGIYKRYVPEAKFIRGKGYIAEFNHNESASKAIEENPLFTAFKNTDYVDYSKSGTYLSDDSAFIQKPKGRYKNMFTIQYDSDYFGVYECLTDGYIFVSSKYDPNCNTVLSFKASDHDQNTIMLSHYSYIWKTIRDAYQMGALRFSDLKAKSIIYEILAIDMFR